MLTIPVIYSLVKNYSTSVCVDVFYRVVIPNLSGAELAVGLSKEESWQEKTNKSSHFS
jgi:hypothetical protein